METDHNTHRKKLDRLVGNVLIYNFHTRASVSHSCGSNLQFPSWFKFGAASAAFQVEGAWNVSDKGESKWDRLTHRYPELIADGSNGDDACNSYFLWERDIEMAAELGLQFYRFSISWPRLLPTGFANNISEDGKNYYNNLIDGLLEKGIEPLVTIHHYDTPQRFQDLGGWANPKIADWFAEYARVVYSLYGDRVKTWITINEPFLDCDWYYGQGVLNPVWEDFVGPYICNKNLLLAHAKAYHVYDQEFRYKYNGKVSIANQLVWLLPNSNSTEDLEVTEAARQFLTGRYTHAIFSKEGGWPSVVEETVAKVSKEQGYEESRLPAFTQEEIDLIRGTFDYFALNLYTSRLVRKPRPSENVEKSLFGYIGDLDAVMEMDPNWPFGYSQLLVVYPQGLRDQMLWLKQQYGDIEILITENGYSTGGSELNDDGRVSFIRDHLEQVLLSIEEGVNVTGYTYWALMDNFEWRDGYTSKFGLYEVDFSDANRTRTPRKSAKYYAELIKKRSL
ncbi:hypothetical protein PYW07_009719 [Mythimna separata]|uniref:Myrosinase 1-like n=1 Tax=Mythimna separata TaxID=271217 RepID=A0AAD7YC07_MYTSE|nr:hypothetical protein PYW07_009719 [Mythimna separata]